MPSNEKAKLQTSSSNVAPQDEPPAYEHPIIIPNLIPTPSRPVPTQNPLDALARLSKLDFSRYKIPQSKLSDDRITITTTDPELSSKQYALIKFINEQAELPPKPIMIIKGTHTGGSGRDYGETVVDFELKINLTSMLDLERNSETEAGRGQGRIRVKMYQFIAGEGSNTTPPRPRRSSRPELNPLERWVKRYCEDETTDRSFTLHRHLEALPVEVLEGLVRTLVASVKYRGKVTVEFPMQYSNITIISRSGGNWFTNWLKFKPTKKYEVVESCWTIGGESIDNFDGLTTGSSSQANQNGMPSLIAQEWWREWSGTVLNAVLGKKRGWLTAEDWIEWKMGVREKGGEKEWGVEYESGNAPK